MNEVMTEAEVATILEKAGFTGIGTKAAPLPDYLMSMFGSGVQDPNRAEESGRQMGYLRIKTDQGEFGLWSSPYPFLDVHGTGLNWGDLGYRGKIEELPPEMRVIVGLDDITLLLFRQRLVQRKLKP